MANNSNPQTKKFDLITGALGYRTRSDITATPKQYLVAGSQNVLINEATDKEGDKVESRAGYTMKGLESTDRNKIKSEFVFKTKVGSTVMGRMDDNGDLEYYSEESDAWETLLTGLDGSYPLRWATIWDSSALIRKLLFVNHSSNLYEWSGAVGTLSAITDATHITINETIATRGFNAAGTIRIKDSGGTWRTATYTSTATSVFTVTTDLTAFTFDANAIVVEGVKTTATTPASGFTNDVIKVLENHVYIGSHSSSIVYMSKSTSYTDYAFSSPRVATDGWQFVLDDFTVGFETNIAEGGKESMVFFAGNDWIYRVQFVDITDTSIAQLAQIKPIIVSSGQGALVQELIAKVKNSIIFINSFNELLELSILEGSTTVTQTPLSDPIKPDFLAADFTGGSMRFWHNNLFVLAAASGRMFILAFRQNEQGTRRFWQPPQLLPVGQTSDYGGDLIGHSNSLTESYVLFDGTNDNGKPIAFKAHFAYNNSDLRDKLKNYDKYLSELYLTSNTTVRHVALFEYLGAKNMKTFEYSGTDTAFLVVGNPNASLGVNSLGTNPLGAPMSSPADFLKYRRFKKMTPIDHFEYQTRYECDDIDGQFQILCHGPNIGVSRNAPTMITN